MSRPVSPCQIAFGSEDLRFQCHVAGIWQGESTTRSAERCGHAPICQSRIAGDGSGLQTLASRLCILVDVWSWTQSGKRIAPDQVAPPETHLDDHAARIARFRCMAMRQWSLNTSPFATYHFFSGIDGPYPWSAVWHNTSSFCCGATCTLRAVVAAMYSDLGTKTPRHP